MPEMVHVVVREAVETLMPDVRRETDSDEQVHNVPAGLVDAFERAVKAVYDVGQAIVTYTQGAAAAATAVDQPEPQEGAVRVHFGDPRYCWNPVRHRPHDYRYEDRNGDFRGSFWCDGDGETAAWALGYEQNGGQR